MDFSSLKRPLEKYRKGVVRGVRRRSIHHYCVRPGHLVGTHQGCCNLEILSLGPARLLLPREKTTVSSAINVYATVTDPRIYAHPQEETSALVPRYRGILSFAVAMESHNQGTALITWPANLHLGTNRTLIVGKQACHLAMPRAPRSLFPSPFMKSF
jgi:hypothetical protein